MAQDMPQPASQKSRLIRRVMFVVGLVAMILLGHRGYNLAKKAYAIANPVINILPLPPSHIGADTPKGVDLLNGSAKADYASLSNHFSPQQYLSYCGVASGVVATNSLLGKKQYNQDNWFDDLPSALHSSWNTFFGGMTLQQFSALVEARGLHVRYTHGGDGSIDEFRKHVIDGSANSNDVLVVNYSRKALEQKGWGHFSPVAAYHGPSDRVLILDVGAHKYTPSWVKLDALWRAMDTPDSDSGKNRGYVIISSPPGKS